MGNHTKSGKYSSLVQFLFRCCSIPCCTRLCHVKTVEYYAFCYAISKLNVENKNILASSFVYFVTYCCDGLQVMNKK